MNASLRAQHKPSQAGAPRHHCLLPQCKHRQLTLLTQHRQQADSLKESGIKKGAFFQLFQRIPTPGRTAWIPAPAKCRYSKGYFNPLKLFSTVSFLALQQEVLAAKEIPFLHGFTIFVQRTQASYLRGLGNKQQKKTLKDKVKANYAGPRTGSFLLLFNNNEASKFFPVSEQYLLASKNC